MSASLPLKDTDARTDTLETVDGDLVDETTPISRSEAGPDSLHVWGPPLPETFLQ